MKCNRELRWKWGYLIGWSMLALCVGALVAVAEAQRGAVPEEYRIGFTTPLTGTNAPFGKAFAETVRMAVDELNAQGGIDGIKMRLIIEDTAADPKQGIAAFQKLASVDRVPVVSSAWSTVIMATAPLADREKVLLINHGANAPSIRGAGKLLISSFPLADLDIKLLAQYAIRTLGMKRGAVLYVNNDTGRLNAKVFKENFEAGGGKIVAFESHEADAIEFGAQAAKIRAGQPDIIHIPSLVQEAPRIVKQLREMGIKAQFTSYSVAESKEMLSVAGEAADGLLYTALAPPADRPGTKAVLDKYKATYQKDPVATAYLMYVWDLHYTILPEAIRYAKQQGWGYSGEAIQRAILTVKTFDTKATGKTVFQEDGTVQKPVYLKRVNVKEKRFEYAATLE